MRVRVIPVTRPGRPLPPGTQVVGEQSVVAGDSLPVRARHDGLSSIKRACPHPLLTLQGNTLPPL